MKTIRWITAGLILGCFATACSKGPAKTVERIIADVGKNDFGSFFDAMTVENQKKTVAAMKQEVMKDTEEPTRKRINEVCRGLSGRDLFVKGTKMIMEEAMTESMKMKAAQNAVMPFVVVQESLNGDHAVVTIARNGVKHELSMIKEEGQWKLADGEAQALLFGGTASGQMITERLEEEEAFRTKCYLTKLSAKSLRAAIMIYHNEYNRMPLTVNEDRTWGESGQKEVLDVLQGNDPVNNPKKIRFLDVADDALIQQGPWSGSMVDPWGQPYRIAVDGNYDGRVEPATNNGIVAVWSCGPNRRDERGQGDDIKSW